MKFRAGDNAEAPTYEGRYTRLYHKANGKNSKGDMYPDKLMHELTLLPSSGYPVPVVYLSTAALAAHPENAAKLRVVERIAASRRIVDSRKPGALIPG